MRKALVVFVICAGAAAPVQAQSLLTTKPCGPAPSTRELFVGTADAFRHVASRESLTILAVGGATALAGHAADRGTTNRFAHDGALRDAFRPGALIGSAPFELGTSMAVYAIGRALHKPCAAAVGADLFQAQLLGQVLTVGLKQAA